MLRKRVGRHGSRKIEKGEMIKRFKPDIQRLMAWKEEGEELNKLSFRVNA